MLLIDLNNRTAGIIYHLSLGTDGSKLCIACYKYICSIISRLCSSELEKTMGQLQLYQWALEEQEPERQLFLAVSQQAYIKHFQKAIFQLAVERNKMNLLVYEPSQEVVLEWIKN